MAKMSYQDVLAIDKRRITAAFKRALKGDKDAFKQVYSITNALKVESNKRLRALQRAQLDVYQSAVNAYTFTDTYGKKRFLSSNELNRDVDDMWTEYLQMRKFLEAETSTVGGAREVFEKQKEWFIEKDVFSEEQVYDMNKYHDKGWKEFLKFLHEEEIDDTVERLKPDSDKIVEAIADLYENQGSRGLEIARNAMGHYLTDDNMTIDKAFKQYAGVDYRNYFFPAMSKRRRW